MVGQSFKGSCCKHYFTTRTNKHKLHQGFEELEIVVTGE